MWQDFRFAWRSLANNPGFAAAALATLSLGIGASTVAFTFVNALLLRPLPFGEATPRIVSLHATHPTQFPEDWDDAGVSYLDLMDVEREAKTLEAVAGLWEINVTLYGEETVRVSGATITPNLFDFLGATPALGRNFRPEDGARIGFETAAILSDGLWRARYGADPNIVGRAIVVNERELEVVGVMPEGFRYPETKDLWVAYDPGEDTNRQARGMLAVGRLAKGATLSDARLELSLIAERLEERFPESNRGWSLHVLPYRDLVVKRNIRIIAPTMLAAVALVLLVGCANLASLLLARGAARQRELAVRSAMGASRKRLIREMLVESLLLGVLGGLLGTLIAMWGLDALVASFPEELPYWLRFDLDGRVAAFIMGLSLLTSVAFGLLPAWRASSVGITAALGSSRDPSATKQASSLQGALIIGQIAVSVALLAGAALMYQNFLNLRSADSGFDDEKLLTMRVYLAGDAYDPVPAKTEFFRALVDTLRALPGVANASVTTSVPTDDGGAAARVVTREHPVVDGTEIGVSVVASTAGFFDTMGVELVEGRGLVDTDLSPDAAPVAIVNASLARKLWPDRSEHVGQELGLVTRRGVQWLRIIGVAPHIQYEEFGEETAQSKLNVFVPYPVVPSRPMAVLVRAENDPEALARPVRDALRSFAPGLPIYLMRTMGEVRYMTTWEQRLFGQMFNAFAVSAVLLACLGIYGLVAYRVSRRRRELGIRLALGASRNHVMDLLLRHSIALCGAGLAIGFLLSLGVSRVLESVIYGQHSGSASLFAGIAVILLVPVAVATYVPARRAARIDPSEALRQE